MTWKDPSKYVQEIFVEESVADLPYTKEIIERAGLPVHMVPARGKPNDLDAEYVRNLTAGKRQLFLTANRGQFFKPCPGTREYQCCKYQVLGCGAGCPMDCVYCILQAYLNTPWILHFVNVEKMFDELREGLGNNPAQFFRIGTGEFTDSLALDRFTGLSRKLVPFFRDCDNAVLELKTKSAVIDNLIDLDHGGRTVVAWSLNSPLIMETEEIRSATLDERLEAAARCASLGYHLAFHFDPIIEHEGWEEGYAETIRRLYSVVPAESIVWISLGALRYIPKLKEIGIHRFPNSKIYYNEFINGLDNKSRYFRPKRVRLYQHIYGLLKERAAERTCIYFCMESDEIWREVMGFAPDERGGLRKMLDISVQG
ncbi:MAG: radical SAM protein [Desulforhopalus sp.]|nr:radical SAM protein [Desulforhopalus sp.]